jgi:hypothetical protein
MSEPIWAIIFPDGKIVAGSDFKDEAHAWQMVLGWPDEEEIERAKQEGYKAVRVTWQIVEEKPGDGN